MKIIELKAQNFKRLSAVTIRPGDVPVVEITGANAQGKSSVIDAIWAALGGKSFKADRPIKEGEREAAVTVMMDGYTVTRKWTPKGTYLTVTKGDDNRTVKSPQMVLDGFLGNLSLDPVAFTRLSGAKQTRALLDLLNIDIDDMDARRATAYDHRTEINRQLQAEDRRLLDLGKPEDGLPDAPVDASALGEAWRDGMNAQARCEGIEKDIGATGRVVAELKERLSLAEQAHQHARDSIRPDVPDVAAIKAQMDNAAAINAKIAHRERHAEVKGEWEWCSKEKARLEDEIAAIDNEQEKALSAAKMPMPGLSFDAEGLTLKGIPFAQLSTSERLQIAVFMAMAQKPAIRIVRIEDGSVLDTHSMEMLRGWASEHEYQVWLERVDESGKVGIVIEDGEVVSRQAAEE